MREARAQHTTSRWTIRRARTLAQVAGFIGLVASAACGGDGPTQPSGPTPSGNYSITTVNGHALPVAVAQDASYMYEVTNGTLALTTDGKFSIVTTYRQTIPGNVSMFVDSTGGTWTQSGTTITLTNTADGTTDTGTWATTQLRSSRRSTKVTTTSVYTKK